MEGDMLQKILARFLQASEGLLFCIGSRGFYPKITSNQPKRLLSLMSNVEDKGKDKGKGVSKN